MRAGDVGAVTELSKHGELAIDALNEGLRGEKFGIRLSCLNMLISLGDLAGPSADYAASMLTAEEDAIRKRAADLLGQVATSAASRAAVPSLAFMAENDSIEEVRAAAGQAMRRIIARRDRD